MIRKFAVAAATFGIAGALFSPSPKPAHADTVPAPPPALMKSAPGPAEGDHAFAMRMLHTTDPGNVFLSPASIRVAFAMAQDGARGATAIEMQKALDLGANPARTSDELGGLIRQWNAPKQEGLELSVVNRAYVDRTQKLAPTFQTDLGRRWGAGVQSLDFKGAPDASRQTINDFVDANTKHKIPQLLAPPNVTSGTRMVLVNAVYLKGTWETKFEDAVPATFHLRPGTDKSVPTMHVTRSLKWGETSDAELLELPYKGGASMLVILPKQLDGLAAVERALDGKTLDAAIAGMHGETVSVALPKLKVSTRLDLRGSLEAMGMKSAFDARVADFSGITGARDLFINAAVHQAVVDVNEKGTEAAAATGIGFGEATAVPMRRSFRADHPFLFLIRDAGGNVLFVGRIVDPKV